MQSLSLDSLVLLSAIVITACEQPDGTNVITVSTDETYSVVFQDDSTVTAVVYCNACGTSYEAGSDGSISIELLYCTEVLCDESQVQDLFPSALHGATYWSMQINKLSIVYSFNGDTGTLEFEADVREGISDAYPLIGTLWLLKSIQLE